MGNSEHLETFSLNACHLHPRGTHWHPWNCQTSVLGRSTRRRLIDEAGACPSMTYPSTKRYGKKPVED